MIDSALAGATPSEAYEKDFRRSCSSSATTCQPLCRLNHNTKS